MPKLKFERNREIVKARERGVSFKDWACEHPEISYARVVEIYYQCCERIFKEVNDGAPISTVAAKWQISANYAQSMYDRVHDRRARYEADARERENTNLAQISYIEAPSIPQVCPPPLLASLNELIADSPSNSVPCASAIYSEIQSYFERERDTEYGWAFDD